MDLQLLLLCAISSTLLAIGMLIHSSIMEPVYSKGIISILDERQHLEFRELLLEIRARGGFISSFALLLLLKQLEEDGDIVSKHTKHTDRDTGITRITIYVARA